MRDIMQLRRIYVTRRGLHAMERRALLSQAPVSHHHIPLPSDNLTQLSDLASQLKKNAADDYRVYHRIACALRRGVSCAKICLDMLLLQCRRCDVCTLISGLAECPCDSAVTKFGLATFLGLICQKLEIYAFVNLVMPI